MQAKNDDYELVNRLKNGEQEAFERLFKKYHDKLFYFSFRYLRSKEEAEELVQDIFMKIWEIKEDINPFYSFNNYLFTIARNTLFNIHRKKINVKAYKDYLVHFFVEYSQDATDVPQFNDTKEYIDRCIAELPDQQKKVFRLSRFEGLSYKEISEMLNISSRTVEAHIRLAMKSIKSKLKNERIFALLLFLEVVSKGF